MLSGLLNRVVAALDAAGLSAGCAWPKTAPQRDRSFVRVSLARAEDCAGGFARYLGLENDTETGTREVYGLQCALELRLDVYAPLGAANAALACLDLFDTAAGAISALPGLRVQALHCDAPAPDRESGMFRLRGGVRCGALLISSDSGEAGTFTDFVLRGELEQ